MLVAVNGVELTYDENGNVLTYGDREYSWNTGRHLESITDGDNEYSYTYDENGIRTSKTVNGVTTYYNTSDGVILSQTDGTNTMYFQYDSFGIPLGFIYNDTQYLYMTNQMGDVISITDAQGNELVEYEYDEWGKLILTRADNQSNESIANINPIRYRGYYYDTETGYYYLQSRYYDPSICRFINADIYEIVNSAKNTNHIGLNLFVYCGNDAVNNADYNGAAYSPLKAKAYAEKWWNGTNSRYGRNPNGDCANFVSQCLYAGGLNKMTGTAKWGWHNYKITTVNLGRIIIGYDRSHAWAAAQNLYDWLRSTKHTSYTYVLKSIYDVDKVGKILYSKSTCAAAIFFTWPKRSNKGHAALSGQVVRYKNSYDVYYYAHTSNRNGKRYYGNKRKYYSLKDFLKSNKGAKIHVCILK